MKYRKRGRQWPIKKRVIKKLLQEWKPIDGFAQLVRIFGSKDDPGAVGSGCVEGEHNRPGSVRILLRSLKIVEQPQ